MTNLKDFELSTFKESGIPVSDYCEVCDKGDQTFYMLETKDERSYVCEECKAVSNYPKEEAAQ